MALNGRANTTSSSSGAQPEYVPGEQGVGCTVPAADCAQDVPAGQGVAPASVVLVSGQYVPSGQPVQAAAEALLYRPAAQGVGDATPAGQNDPAGQGAHCAVAPAPEKLPAAQGEQVVALPAEKKPFWHTVALASVVAGAPHA